MNAQMERMEKEEVSGWPNISVHPHRFSAREFRFGKAEVGHVHMGGIVDIPFPRPIRDALGRGSCRGTSVGSQLWVDYLPRSHRTGPPACAMVAAPVLHAIRAENRPRSTQTVRAGA